MNTEIIWKQVIINGIKCNYEVSNTGFVKSLISKKLLKQFLTSTGYYRVALYINGKRKNIFVHRLVAMAFVPISDEYLQLGLSYDDLVPDHLDYNPLNNNYWNFEWKTLGDNTRSARDNGHFPIGEKSHLSVISEMDALNIIEMLLDGYNVNDISKKLNISKSIILHIKNKECWKSLTKDITFPKHNNSTPFSVSEDIIHEICRLLEIGELRQIDIAHKLGVKREYVKDIKNRRRRVDISQMYDF